jgi:hypothetical protein
MSGPNCCCANASVRCAATDEPLCGSRDRRAAAPDILTLQRLVAPAWYGELIHVMRVRDILGPAYSAEVDHRPEAGTARPVRAQEPRNTVRCG